ncbi:hypothetical protein OG539_04220 [Actinacidiphila glaucinigra]
MERVRAGELGEVVEATPTGLDEPLRERDRRADLGRPEPGR